MSWWVSLNDEKGIFLEIPNFTEGRTYCIGGSTEAHLNITYNYDAAFRIYLHPDGIRFLHGKTGKETISSLEIAVVALGTKADSNYWGATKGNAGAVLAILLSWAKLHPEGKWRVN